MSWEVEFHKRAAKDSRDLPEPVRLKLRALVEDIKVQGPTRGNWPHYGKLKREPNGHHCHLKGGRPTFVVCWRVIGPQKVEVYYVGTHENAPY